MSAVEAVVALGDSLRGLVIRYRAAHEAWCQADLSQRALVQRENISASTSRERLAASERVGAAARLCISLEGQILKRLREDGDAILDVLLEYGR